MGQSDASYKRTLKRVAWYFDQGVGVKGNQIVAVELHFAFEFSSPGQAYPTPILGTAANNALVYADRG